jgi:hypothetical protein
MAQKQRQKALAQQLRSTYLLVGVSVVVLRTLVVGSKLVVVVVVVAMLAVAVRRVAKLKVLGTVGEVVATLNTVVLLSVGAVAMGVGVVSVVVDSRANDRSSHPSGSASNEELLGLGQTGNAGLDLGKLGVADLEVGVVLERRASSGSGHLGVNHLLSRVLGKERLLRHGVVVGPKGWGW